MRHVYCVGSEGIINFSIMKLPLYWLIYFGLLSQISLGQKLFKTDYAHQADFKVFIVEYAHQADLSVFTVDYDHQAKGNEGLWIFTKYAHQADKSVFFVDYLHQADLKIFMVKYPHQAKWHSSSKKHLMFR